jgi:hypothetical protein
MRQAAILAAKNVTVNFLTAYTELKGGLEGGRAASALQLEKVPPMAAWCSPPHLAAFFLPIQ